MTICNRIWNTAFNDSLVCIVRVAIVIGCKYLGRRCPRTEQKCLYFGTWANGRVTQRHISVGHARTRVPSLLKVDILASYCSKTSTIDKQLFSTAVNKGGSSFLLWMNILLFGFTAPHRRSSRATSSFPPVEHYRMIKQIDCWTTAPAMSNTWPACGLVEGFVWPSKLFVVVHVQYNNLSLFW